VEKQPHPQNSPQGDAPAAWQSTVRFELPNLGTISARLNMLGQHLQIQIQTTSEDSANALRQHAGALAEALGAAGSSLDSLLVQPNEQH
jgi:hypothetical protein